MREFADMLFGCSGLLTFGMLFCWGLPHWAIASAHPETERESWELLPWLLSVPALLFASAVALKILDFALYGLH